VHAVIVPSSTIAAMALEPLRSSGTRLRRRGSRRVHESHRDTASAKAPPPGTATRACRFRHRRSRHRRGSVQSSCRPILGGGGTWGCLRGGNVMARDGRRVGRWDGCMPDQRCCGGGLAPYGTSVGRVGQKWSPPRASARRAMGRLRARPTVLRRWAGAVWHLGWARGAEVEPAARIGAPGDGTGACPTNGGAAVGWRRVAPVTRVMGEVEPPARRGPAPVGALSAHGGGLRPCGARVFTSASGRLTSAGAPGDGTGDSREPHRARPVAPSQGPKWSPRRTPSERSPPPPFVERPSARARSPYHRLPADRWWLP